MNVMIKKMCNQYNIQIIENKDIEPNINLLKRHAANEIGYMLPNFK